MRSTADKLTLFRRFFTARTDVYGTYDSDTGRVWQAKEPVTDAVLLAHLTGRQPYGPYLLQADRTAALVVDFDDADPASPRLLTAAGASVGLTFHIERSKSKGYHAWLFFPGADVPAAKSRAVAARLLGRIAMADTEVFPKQDSLSPANPFGNFINAPLFGKLVPQGKTVFVDPANGMAPFPDQWAFLEQVQTVAEEQLEQALEALGATAGEPGRTGHTAAPGGGPAANGMRFVPKSSLPICAQRMLNDGVVENQRVVCFRLAIHFNRLGIPFDITVAALRAWAIKNHPRDGKTVITGTEIEEQADWAYKKAYRGFGCSDEAVRPFCDRECPLYPRIVMDQRGLLTQGER